MGSGKGGQDRWVGESKPDAGFGKGHEMTCHAMPRRENPQTGCIVSIWISSYLFVNSRPFWAMTSGSMAMSGRERREEREGEKEGGEGEEKGDGD